MSTVTAPSPAPSTHPVKPALRGWLHLGMAPLILVAGVLLTATAPTLATRLGSAVYTLMAVQLFGTSAVYHRGSWGPRLEATLRRLDHSNIFLFIAGSYTPLTLALLDGRSQATLLILVWSMAILGVVFRTTWLGAPRWLYTLLYLGMGWAAIGWLPAFWTTGGPVVVLLIAAGGIVYSLGAVAYALKRPGANARRFGYHEVFHACTIVAAICHLIAIWLAVFS
ncbi:MAG TPA: hemolysin III family protein [Arachnia sp.]|nr:hemolysin III family protein [Arachnia sp.]HMT85343.1 hemolysin III family protein [Arachnia sp.]